jgi:catechol 2,3-dioxygenase-like lactoylglutathione lyase family enzyme
MLDPVSIAAVRELERSRRFYDAALRPLGIVRTLDFEHRGSDYGTMAGQLGVEFTITLEVGDVIPVRGIHVCFRAHDREAVRAFHAAAIAAAGSDDGAPGTRPRYHRDYYAAFVIDPDGHRIEAVCHAPTGPDVIE